MKNTLLLLSICIINETWGQSSQQSIYERRNILLNQADSLLENGKGNTPEYFNLQKKIASTDTDTFLVAANAYGAMKFVFALHDDSTYEKLATESELYCINKSLAKYPDNFDAYVYRIQLYKYGSLYKYSSKEGEEAFIKAFQEKFAGRWEMNLVMADYYIHYTFLLPNSKDFEVCSNYLKKTVELNPKEFNSLLLLSVAYENNKNERMMYLKKMYVIAPEQFIKNTERNKNKVPFVVKSISKNTLLGKDMTVGLSVAECTMLNLK